MSELRQRMKRLMQLRRFSQKTQDSYERAMVGLVRHYRVSPDQLSEEALHEYLRYLAIEKDLAWSSCNVVASAMKFFYNQVLADRQLRLKIPKRKTPRRLAEVLSREEVDQLLACCSNRKHHAFLLLVYSSGLRLKEATRLRVSDIDSDRMMLRIEQGKGREGSVYGLSGANLNRAAGVLSYLPPFRGVVFWPRQRPSASGRQCSKVVL